MFIYKDRILDRWCITATGQAVASGILNCADCNYIGYKLLSSAKLYAENVIARWNHKMPPPKANNS